MVECQKNNNGLLLKCMSHLMLEKTYHQLEQGSYENIIK